MADHSYNPAFFTQIEDGSRSSARAIVPAILDWLHPASVIDVGCATGAWLSVFQEHGIRDYLGIDGDYVDREALLIPENRFLPRDLAQPIQLDRRFDLAVSLEVAEHLPPESAAGFVETLTRLSDQIVFSAAIPLQGGTRHRNEQWPEYWKALFEARGYVPIDCLRPRFWYHRDVERWYRQNILLYVKSERLKSLPNLNAEYERTRQQPLSLVHPAIYRAPSIKTLLRMFPHALISAVRRRLKRD